MRKYIFISFLLIIFLLGNIICKNNSINITNKIYKQKNIEVNYPHFKIENIDNYIDNYITSSINLNYNNIFLDYDYNYINKNEVELTFYEHYSANNILKLDTCNLNINLRDKYIKKNINKKDKDVQYNFVYNQKIDKTKPIIAFSFDDGPNYNTSKLIDVLNKYNARATFFVLGSKIKGNEKVLKKMVDNNMEIGNHTYSHKLLTRLTNSKIEDEINKTNELIYNVTNTKPVLFRPSYGSFNKKIKEISNSPIIIWDIDTLDWKYHNSKMISKNILKKAKDGDIILMHDIYSATVNAVDQVLPELIKQGYQVVTVSEMFYYKNIVLEKGKIYGSAK